MMTMVHEALEASETGMAIYSWMGYRCSYSLFSVYFLGGELRRCTGYA